MPSDYGVEYTMGYVSSYPLVAYCVAVLGIATAIASYRRSRATPWLISVAVGVLVTMATFGIGLSGWGHLVKYGFPFGWLAIVYALPVPPHYPHFHIMGAIGWAFALDVLIWSYISAVLLVLISASRFRSRRV